ncbi:hypothetical protein RCL1_007886 [Eukaryota sp. TZLM3-RCL]
MHTSIISLSKQLLQHVVVNSSLSSEKPSINCVASLLLLFGNVSRRFRCLISRFVECSLCHKDAVFSIPLHYCPNSLTTTCSSLHLFDSSDLQQLQQVPLSLVKELTFRKGNYIAVLSVLDSFSSLRSLTIETQLPFGLSFPNHFSRTLTSLALHNCRIYDIVDISVLSSLEQFSLSHLCFTNLDSFKVLKKLRCIKLDSCSQLDCIEGISRLSNLISLEISNCRSLRFIGTIATNSNFQSLAFSNCLGQISQCLLTNFQYNPLLYLSTLTVSCTDQSAKLVSRRFPNLKQLCIETGSFSNFEAFSSLSFLQSLTVESNSTLDLQSIGLLNVTELRLKAVQLSNFNYLRFCKSLLVLNIDVDECELFSLENLNQVEHLVFSCSSLLSFSLSNFEKCSSVVVTLGSSQLCKINNFKSLKRLSLDGNVTSLGISNCNVLRFVDLCDSVQAVALYKLPRLPKMTTSSKSIICCLDVDGCFPSE